MKLFAKAAFGALAIGMAALGTTAPAQARTDFGVYIGTGPGYGYGPRHYRDRDPCERPYYARPAFCGYPVYRGPVYLNRWYDGPFHYRYDRGRPQYWHGDRWRDGRPGPGRGHRRHR